MKFMIEDGGFSAQAEALRRRITDRTDAVPGEGGLRIVLRADPALGAPESYSVSSSGDTCTVTGSDGLGVWYGVGKLLHSASWTEHGFTPRPTGGTVSPDCPFRCIYFSIHFHNWYQQAEPEELESYLEDLLLYGYNAVECIIPVVQLESFEDEIFFAAVKKSRLVFSAAKRLGMKTLAGVCPNQGMKSAPHDWDADLSYDLTGKYRGWLGRNVCPNKPGALEYMRGIWMKVLEQYLDIGVDYVLGWPYDEGGCGCEKCAPWGAGGFDKLCRVFARDAKRLYPGVKFIYSTWTFDVPNDQKEYATLYKRLAAGEMDYVDYLMIDAHGDFPRYPLEHPPVRPIVNFPEISMWGLYPWGGFGAVVLPRRFQQFWNSSKAVLYGGMPYSEGLYEDASKVQCVGYYWNKNAHYRDVLGEYAAYEFGADASVDAVRLMELIERNHTLVRGEKAPDLATAREALGLARSIDARLSEKRRQSWRWRILFIRAVLDEKRYAAFFDMGLKESYADLHRLRHDREEDQILKNDRQAQELYAELRRIYRCIDYFRGDNAATLPVVQNRMKAPDKA